MKIWADPFCPGNIGYALQTNTWELASLDKAPHIVDDDGMGWFRVYNETAVLLFTAIVVLVTVKPF